MKMQLPSFRTVLLASGGILCMSQAASADWCLQPGIGPGGGASFHASGVFETGTASGYVNPTPPGQKVRLHAVSSYDAGGRIRVGTSPEPIVLLVNGFRPSIWTLEVAPGARIEKIWITGNREQKVIGIPAGVPVETVSDCQLWADVLNPRDSSGGSARFHESFRTFVEKKTGYEVSEFQSFHEAGSFTVPMTEKPVAVGKRGPTTTGALDADAAARALRMLSGMSGRKLLPPSRFVSGPGSQVHETAPWPVAFQGQGPVDACSNDRDARTGSDQVVCRGRESNIVATGEGEDVIQSSNSSDIFAPGPGDDIVDFGWGSDTLVIEGPGWGSDTVYKSCARDRLDDRERASYGRQFSMVNQIVFGPGIDPEGFDVETQPRPGTPEGRRLSKMTYRATGDSLTLDDDCFDLAFAEGVPGRNYREGFLADPAEVPVPVDPASRAVGIRKLVDTMAASGLLPEQVLPVVARIPVVDPVAYGPTPVCAAAKIVGGVASDGECPSGPSVALMADAGGNFSTNASTNLVVSGPGSDIIGMIGPGVVWVDAGGGTDHLEAAKCSRAGDGGARPVIVFGPGVMPQDIEAVATSPDGKQAVLRSFVNRKTGDEIVVSSDCFDVAFASGWPGVGYTRPIVEKAYAIANSRAKAEVVAPAAVPPRVSEVVPPSLPRERVPSVGPQPLIDVAVWNPSAIVQRMLAALMRMQGWQYVYAAFIAYFAGWLFFRNRRKGGNR